MRRINKNRQLRCKITNSEGRGGTLHDLRIILFVFIFFRDISKMADLRGNKSRHRSRVKFARSLRQKIIVCNSFLMIGLPHPPPLPTWRFILLGDGVRTRLLIAHGSDSGLLAGSYEKKELIASLMRTPDSGMFHRCYVSVSRTYGRVVRANPSVSRPKKESTEKNATRKEQ